MHFPDLKPDGGTFHLHAEAFEDPPGTGQTSRLACRSWRSKTGRHASRSARNRAGVVRLPLRNRKERFDREPTVRPQSSQPSRRITSNSRSQDRAKCFVGVVATPSSKPDSTSSADTYQAERGD